MSTDPQEKSNTPLGYDPTCLRCNLRSDPNCIKCYESQKAELGKACADHRTPCGITKHPLGEASAEPTAPDFEPDLPTAPAPMPELTPVPDQFEDEVPASAPANPKPPTVPEDPFDDDVPLPPEPKPTKVPKWIHHVSGRTINPAWRKLQTERAAAPAHQHGEQSADEVFHLANNLALRAHLAEYLEPEGNPSISPEQARRFEAAFSARLKLPGVYCLEDFIDQHGLTTAAAKPIILRVLGQTTNVNKLIEDAIQEARLRGSILYGPTQLQAAMLAAEDVLRAIGGKYYESNRRLVMPSPARSVEPQGLSTSPTKVPITRDDASVILVDISRETIDRDLDKHGRFVKEANGRHVVIQAPSVLGRHIQEHVKNYPNEVPFPRLDMLVNTPVLLPSGEVHDAPDELRSSVLFLAAGSNYPRVPSQPARDDAREALKKFEPIFCEFPFIKERDEQPWYETPSYSVVLAACLTIAARAALPVAVPLFAIKAPKPRSGKTKIADATTRAMTGHKPTTIHYRNEEEFGKTLLPLLLHQDRVVLIDNIAQPFRSAKFAPLVTNNFLTDRWLGRSEDVTLYNRAVFFATGNNLLVTGDLAWRSLLVSIDANVEHPEARHFGFQPEECATRNHPELVTAALTALRAFVLAGKPWSLSRAAWGGFEDWDRLVAGCLVWLGYADPKITCQTVITDDPEREATVGLLATWYDEVGDKAIRLEEIEKNPLSETRRQLLGAKGEWNAREIGWRLRNMRDRVEGGYKLVKGTGVGGSDRYYWKVVRVGSFEPPASTARDDGRVPF